MNFQHTEDRRMLADTLNRFIAQQYDFSARDKIAASPQGFSPVVYARFAELGALGALFDEAHGGLGGAGFDISVVFESLGRGLVVEPLLGALMVGQAIAHSGNEAQKKLIEKLVDGSVIAAFAHEEADAHYAPAWVTTRAGLENGGENGGGNQWVLRGAKTVVEHAEAADVLLVSARTRGADDAQDGIALFLVPRAAPGLTLRGYPRVDGTRAAELTLDGVRVGDEALLGGVGTGSGANASAGASSGTYTGTCIGSSFPALEYALGAGVLALCAEAVGAMDVVREHTLEYLRTRKQFGVVIGSFQALQHRMADLLIEIEQARSAVINAAAAFGKDRLARERALAAAKYSIGRIGARVAEESIQLHGGIGMTWELPLAHYAKRLVMIDHQLGDEDHHLTRYIELGKAAA